MMLKIQIRFTKILFSLVFSSILFSMLIWKWGGKELNFSSDHLDLNFFNTICGSFGIAGLLIAIYQISEIRNEREIRKDTIEGMKQRSFTDSALYNLGSIKPQLKAMQASIIKQTFLSEKIINSYIVTVTEATQVFHHIIYLQETLTIPISID